MIRATVAGLALTLALAGTAVAADEQVTIGAATHPGFARMAFAWDHPAPCSAVLVGSTLTLRFAEPFTAPLATIERRLPGYVGQAAYGADHRTVVVAMRKPVAVETFISGHHVVVDLHDLPASAPAAAAAPVAEPVAAPAAKPVAEPVKSAAAPPADDAAIRFWAGRREGGGKRVVLGSDQPFDIALAQHGRTATVTLPRPLASEKDFTAIRDWAPHLAGSKLTMTLPPGYALKRTSAGRRIALDLVRGPAAAAAAEPADAPAKPPAATTASVAAPPAKPVPPTKPIPVAEAIPAAKATPVAKATSAAGAMPLAKATPAATAPITLSFGRGREAGRRLVLASRQPFSIDLTQSGRQVTITLPRRLLRPRVPAALAKLEPRIAGTGLALTLPEHHHLARSEHDGRVVLDLVRDPPATARAAPPVATQAAAAPVAPPLTVHPPAPQPVAQPASQSSAPPPQTAPQSVVVMASADGGSLRFSPAPSAAAVFRRGDYLWVAFDGRSQLDLVAVAAHGAPFIESAEDLHAANGTVLRFRLAAGLAPALHRSPADWVIDLRQQPVGPATPVQEKIELKPPARLAFIAVNPAPPITIADPAVGDRLVIVPLRDPGQGVARDHGLVDVEVLPTAQGLAFVPRSDGVKVAALPDRVEVTGADGLLLSTDVQTTRFRARRERVFDFAAWAGTDPVLQRRQALEQAIVDAKPDARTWPRINLARFFTAIGYGPEACGVLAAIARDDPAAMLDPSLRALRGVAHLIADDPNAAATDLATPLIPGDRDLELWRGALLAERGDAKEAVPAFDHGMSVLASYPPLLHNRLALDAADARLAVGKDDGGLIAKVLGDEPGSAAIGEAHYLQGRILAAKNDVDGAVKIWDAVAAGDDRLSRARALTAKTELLLAHHRIDRAQAIAAFDRQRFAWRGGDIEFELLRRIGRLKIADGDYRGGLSSLREALAEMPQNPKAAATKAELNDAFANLYIGPEAKDVPPLKGLAVYQENRDLMPGGVKGEAITSKLADRLAAVDLLGHAADLLEAEIKSGLAGIEKAKVLTRIAVLRTLDRKPDLAVAALDVPVDGTLPPELATQRQELRGRALLDLGKPADALTALAGDTSVNADKLRGEIAIKSHNWPEAAKVYARLTGDQPPESPLSTERASNVLDWAVALTLANDQAGLVALRDKFTAAMAKTPLAEGFHIVAGTDTSNITDMHELTTRLAQVAELQDFMKNYRQMVAKENLSAVN